MMNNSWKISNPEFKKDILKKLEGQAFMHHIGFDLTKIEAGYIEGSLPIKPNLGQQNGYVHGGVFATVADIVMGFATFSLVAKKDRVVTVNLDINFLAPGDGNQLFAKGWVKKAGRKIFYCESEIFVLRDGEKIVTNTATSVMYKIEPQNQTDPKY